MAVENKRMWQRGALEADLLAADEVPADRELIGASDTGRVWLGDGVSPLSARPFLVTADPMTGQMPDDVRETIAANLTDPTTPEGAAAASIAGIVNDEVVAGYIGSDGASATKTAVATALSDATGEIGSAARSVTTGLGFRPELPAFQVVPDRLANWRIHVARARAGQRAARLLVVGDSTSQGPTDVPHAWPTYLIDMLTAAGVRARAGVVTPATDITDPRWGVIANGGWSKAGNVGPGGGSWYATPSATASLYFSPKVAFDALNVFYIAQTGGGSVAIDIAGTVVGTVDTAASSNSIQMATITTTGSAANTAAALHAPTGGPVNIIGIEPVVPADTSIVTVDNWAQSGTSAAGWVSAYFSLDAITARQPDLTVVMLGINDSLAASPPTADAYIANIAQIVAAASATGDVLLCTFVPSDPTFQSDLGTRQAAYRAALQTYAATNGIPLFDLYGRFDHYRDYNTGGWYRDRVHQSPDANYDIAHAVRSLIGV